MTKEQMRKEIERMNAKIALEMEELANLANWMISKRDEPETITFHSPSRLIGEHEAQLKVKAIAAEAKGYVEKFGLASRVECRAGDYHTDEYEQEAYDVVTIFGALHQESPEQIVDILKRANRALKPGGRLFVLDMMTDATHTAPKFSALFAVNMALTTENGWVFSDEELKGWMREAGFTPGETRPVPPPMPHWLVEAVK